MVGALSIVRFRAAIKEPEELVYLFLIIAVGLGCGACFMITVVGIFFALATIFFYSKYLNSKNVNSSEIINLGIIIEENISDDQINNLIEDLTKDSVELRFISMSRTNKNTSINIDLKPNDFKDLTKITGNNKYAISKFKNNFSTIMDLSL